MRRDIYLISTLFFAVAACSDDPEPLGGNDAQISDASQNRDAESEADATTFPDATATFPDATPWPDAQTYPDATTYPDAEIADAGYDGGEPIDGGFNCGALGSACNAAMACPQQLTCADPPGICVPEARATCGGFAGAMCPGNFPVCLFYDGADYGPCFTQQERACICATPEGRAAFPTC